MVDIYNACFTHGYFPSESKMGELKLFLKDPLRDLDRTDTSPTSLLFKGVEAVDGESVISLFRSYWIFCGETTVS